jgi:hypothetical protein
MAELERETIERAVRWCAEAGRPTTPAEVRAALAPLGWDQLLRLRALLADPPPARPLGPRALADLARGLPAGEAAERELREPRSPPSVMPPAPPPAPRARPSGRSRRAQVVVRKPVAAQVAPGVPPSRPPLVEELLLPAGRGELERLIRRHGGRRPLLVAAIAASHRRADGAPPGDADLDAALEHHGLERGYGRRERDELLHAVRAAGAILAQAATALGHTPGTMAAAVTRLGLDAQVGQLREVRRRDLRTRATLSDRALLLIGSDDKLADLGLLAEFEADLRRRLPEHLRALSAGPEPLEAGLARTLALPVPAVRALLARLGVELRATAAPPKEPRAAPRARANRPPAGAGRPPPRGARPPPGATRPPERGTRPARGGARPPTRGARTPAGRTSASRPSQRPPPAGRPVGPKPTGARAARRRPTR